MSGIQNIQILMNVSLMMSLFEMFVFFDRKSVRPTVLMSVKSYTISDEHNINDKMCHKQNMTKTPTTITLLSRWVSTISTNNNNNNKSEEKPFKCFYRRKNTRKTEKMKVIYIVFLNDTMLALVVTVFSRMKGNSSSDLLRHTFAASVPLSSASFSSTPPSSSSTSSSRWYFFTLTRVNKTHQFLFRCFL